MSNFTPIKLIHITPIFNIAQELERRGIPYTCIQVWDGLQLRFPWHDGDVICHSGSYGHDIGHVESYYFPWDGDGCTELIVEKAVNLLIDLYSKIED